MSSAAQGPVRPILVIEDDRDIRDSLVGILEEEGFAVAGVANGHEALGYLGRASTLPCLILLDLMMPVMDGFEFRAEQRKVPAWSCIPLVVITADVRIAHKAQEMGAVSFIEKPMRLNVLLEVIERVAGASAKA